MRSAQASIAPDAVLGVDVVVDAFAVVGTGSTVGARTRVGCGVFIGRHVRIGEGCVLEPGAVVLDHCVLGDDVHVSSGSVLGSDGFGYVEDQGRHHKIPQVGNVELGNHVRLGAGVCVDRATTGSTRVGDACELAAQVQVGHNVQIGRNSTLMAQVGIAGSTDIGSDVVIEPQAGLQQHIHVGDGAHIGPRAGVINNVPPGAWYTGFPARPQEETAQIEQALGQLPQFIRENFKNGGAGAQEPSPFSER